MFVELQLSRRGQAFCSHGCLFTALRARLNFKTMLANSLSLLVLGWPASFCRMFIDYSSPCTELMHFAWVAIGLQHASHTFWCQPFPPLRWVLVRIELCFPLSYIGLTVPGGGSSQGCHRYQFHPCWWVPSPHLSPHSYNILQYIIIPLLRHFTIFAQENVQNMSPYLHCSVPVWPV